MIAQRPFAGSPWATNQPESRSVTRGELVEMAARVLADHPLDYVWTAADLAPVDELLATSTRDVFVDLATAALDATYPVVSTEVEIEALGAGTVIVGELGLVYRRALPGGLGSASGMVVGTLEVWEQPGAYESGRKVRRQTSQQLAGRVWTVVQRVVAS